MLTRRDYLKYSALAGAACTLPSGLLQALEAGDIIKRAIPKTGEELPIVGLGSSATFRTVAQGDDVSALRAVFETLLENGGTVFDTAPGDGGSEEVAGKIINKNYSSKDFQFILKYNKIQYKFMKFSIRIGGLRSQLADLIILALRNKWVNKKISRGFS